MAIALHYAARSDIGLGRYSNNQDSGYAGPHLLVVADGMGGHAGGDVASSIAVGKMAALDGESHGADARQHLEQSIREAGRMMKARVGDHPELAGMGTTVTSLLRSGDRLVMAHIGDSRAFLLHEGEFSQVTNDHTFVQRLVDEGRISREEADRHPQRSVILRVLGDVDSDDDLDTSVREAHIGDRWLLCSDGLSDFVSRDTLAETLTTITDPGECADRLIQLALRAGGADNITCIVADVVDESSAPPTTPQVVGSAASDRNKPTVATESAASRAAALARPAPPEDEVFESYHDHDDPEAGRGRSLRRWLGGLLLLAVLAGGAYGAWAWTQRQYFVGVDGEDVAIYRGLTDDLGPVSLSDVHRRYELPVDTLPSSLQSKVRVGIAADDLTSAESIVSSLYKDSSVCDPPRPVPTSSPTPVPTGAATTAPAGGALPTPTAPTLAPPSSGPAATTAPPATPSETTDLPEGCP